MNQSHHIILDNFTASLRQSGLSKISVKNYRSDLRKFLAWSFTTNQSPTAKKSFKAFKKHLIESNTKKSSTNRLLSTLRRYGNFLVKSNLTRINPTGEITNLSKKSPASTLPQHSHHLLKTFTNFLHHESLAQKTILNYRSDVHQFLLWSKRHLPTTLSVVQARSPKLSSALAGPPHKFPHLFDPSIHHKFITHLETTTPQTHSSLIRKMASLRRFTAWAQSRDLIAPAIAQRPTPIKASTPKQIHLPPQPPPGPLFLGKKTFLLGSIALLAITSTTLITTNPFFDLNKLFPLSTPQPGQVAGQRIAQATLPSPTPPPAGGQPSTSPSTPTEPTGPGQVPILDELGALNLSASSPAVNAIGGVLALKGNGISIQTNPLSNGSITFAPDGIGTVGLRAANTSGSTLSITNANLITGNLIEGNVGNRNETYNLLHLSNGPEKIPHFVVDWTGNVYLSGKLEDENTTEKIALADSTHTTLPAGKLSILHALADLSGSSTASITSGLFTDAGTITYLTSTSDDFAIGSTTLAAPFSVDVSTQTIRLGTASDASAILTFYASDNNDARLSLNTSDELTLSDANLVLNQDFRVDGGDVSGANGESIDIGEVADGSITFIDSGGQTLTFDIDATNPTINSSTGTTVIDDNLTITTGTTITASSVTALNLAAATLDFNGAGTLQYANASNFLIQDDSGADIFLLTGSTDAISFGNATDNNAYAFLGSGSYTIASLDCSGNANGGAVTANGSGVLSCTDDDSTSASPWTTTAQVIHPGNTTLDVAIGGTATSSATFQVFGDSGKIASTPNTTGTYLDFALETQWTTGDLINADFASGTTQTGAITGIDIDLTNLTADGTNTLYGIHVNDHVGKTGSTEFGIYQEGTNLDIGIMAEAGIAFGAQQTFTDSDATPDVSGGTSFITNTTSFTITDFDGGSDALATGQLLVIESAGAITYDVTASGLNGGTTDIVTAAGDITTWEYDGTDWNLIAFMDDSIDQGVGGGGTPGGSDTQIQYNNGGSFGGTSAFTYNDSTLALTVTDDFNFTFGAAELITIDAEATDNTGTTGIINLDLDSAPTGDATQAAINLDVESITDSASVDTIIGLDVLLTQTSTDNDVIYGVRVQDLAGTPDAGNEYAIYQAGTSWDYGLYIEDDALITLDLTVSGGDITGANSAAIDLGEATSGDIEFYADGDTDDYIAFSTAADVPSIITAGLSDLTIAPTGGDTNVTGNLRLPTDNDHIYLGASSDLDLYHDGSNSFVSNANTGNLFLRNSASNVAFLADNDTDDFAFFSTESNVPYLRTSGTADLKIAPDTGMMEFDGDPATTGIAFDLSLDGLTTGTGLLIDDNTAAGLSTGSLLHINSVSTALAGTADTGDGLLANFDWNPGSADTATGDLFRIRLDGNGDLSSGSIFNIVDESTSIFSVKETKITSALPHEFTAAGDVSIAYDIQFTNQTASTIKTKAPLTIDVGDAFESNDLTLTTHNSGNVYLSPAHATVATTPFAFDAQETFVDSDTTPDVSGGSHFITNTTAVTITDFDAGSGSLEAGHIIFVESAGAITYDVTASGLNGGAADFVTAAGDMSYWIYDGADWNLINWMDDSDTQAGGADLAEWFVSSETLEPGDIVSVAPDQTLKLHKPSNPFDNTVIGIVSTLPGITLGTQQPNSYPIALAGRVPVKISSGSPAIKVGDYITASLEPGVGTKALSPALTLGRALQSWDPSSGSDTVLVFVDTVWADPTPPRLANIDQFTIKSSGSDPLKIENWNLKILDQAIDRVAAFSRATIASLEAGLIQTQHLVADSITVANQPLEEYIQNVIRSTSKEPANNKTGTSGSSGTFATLLATGDATVSGTLTAHKASFDSLSAKALATEELLTTQLETDSLTAAGASISGQLIATDVSSTTGNFGALIADSAHISQVTTDSIEADTIVGLNDHIENQLGNRLTKIEEQIAQSQDQSDPPTSPSSVPSDSFSAISDQSTHPTPDPTISPEIRNTSPESPSIDSDIANTNPQLPDNSGTFDTSLDVDLLAASSDLSATLLNDVDALFVNELLAVLGSASIVNAEITNAATFGSNLLIDKNSLTTLDTCDTSDTSGTCDTLFVQPLGGSLNLLAGLMTLDDSGSVKIAGNLSVSGRLSSNYITPLPESNNITIDLSQPKIPNTNPQPPDTSDTSGTFGTLLLNGNLAVTQDATISGQLIANKTRFGTVLTQNLTAETATISGLARLNQVEAAELIAGSGSFGKLIIASDKPQLKSQSFTTTTVTTNATTGTATLSAFKSAVNIESPDITDDTLIYITPTTTTQNQVIYVSAKESCTNLFLSPLNCQPHFTVALDTPISDDIDFNFWLIN